MGTNVLRFGLKKVRAPNGALLTSSWDVATVYIVTNRLADPVVRSVPPYTPGMQCLVAWDAVTDAEWYSVYCGTNAVISNALQQAEGITSTALVDSTKYFYTVLATNTVGQYGIMVTSSWQDSYPPLNPAIVLNSSNRFTTSSILTARLAAVEWTPMSMALAESQTALTNWIPFVTPYLYAGSTNNGLKTIYAMFRDSAMQTSAIVSASIVLNRIDDSNVPVIVSISPADGYMTPSNTVTMTMSVTGNTIIADVMVNGNAASAGAGSTWTYNAALPAAGTNALVVVARDIAGNAATQTVRYIRVTAADISIALVAPANYVTQQQGSIAFSWTIGSGISSPQYLALGNGVIVTGVSPQSVTLAAGTYRWSVSGGNILGGLSVSSTNTLVLTLPPSVGPFTPQTVREHQVLLLPITASAGATVSYNASAIKGTHAFDTNALLFSLVPDFGTAGQTWNIPWVAQNGAGSATQTLAVTVAAPTKPISSKKPDLFEDTDGDQLTISYSGVKKDNSTVVFNGQRVSVSNAISKGKFVFKIKKNKKGGDGAFLLRTLFIDNTTKSITVGASVGDLIVGASGKADVIMLNGSGATLSNLTVASAKTIAVSKGAIIGVLTVPDGFKKLSAERIVGGAVRVNSAEQVSVKVKDQIAGSRLTFNGSSSEIAVKALGTGGKGSITASKLIIGLPPTANYTNTPSQAGFKQIKTGTITDSEVAGSDYKSGKKSKAPVIKVKSATNTKFYHTKSDGTIEAVDVK